MDNFSSLIARVGPTAFGAIIMAMYATKRFNEPTFPASDNLPQELRPRYLFLKPHYARALGSYVVVSIGIYLALVFWVGPAILPVIGLEAYKDKPAWPFFVALLLVGVLPNTPKYVSDIEQMIRGAIHKHYLVPKRISDIANTLRGVNFGTTGNAWDLTDEANVPISLLWARVVALMDLLNRAEKGKAPPLAMESLVPFKKDLESIRLNYEAVRGNADHHLASDDEEPPSLRMSVNMLLGRQYAFLSWVAASQSRTEEDVNRQLRDLGFDIPFAGKISLFNVIAPTIVCIGAVSGIYAYILYGEDIKRAFLAAFANSCLYWGAVSIALKHRAAQIRSEPRSRSFTPDRLAVIAIRAGLFTWATVAISTIVFRLDRSMTSLQILWAGSGSLTRRFCDFLVYKGASPWLQAALAFPWFILGAVLSVLLSLRVEGSIKSISLGRRLIEGAFFGISLSFAAALSDGMDQSVLQYYQSQPFTIFDVIRWTAVVGFLCGGLIGLTVPEAYKSDLSNPWDQMVAVLLRNILNEAQQKGLGHAWAYTPNEDLEQLTPAEAIRYERLATKVVALLRKSDRENAEVGGTPVAPNRDMPTLIQGGRGQ